MSMHWIQPQPVALERQANWRDASIPAENSPITYDSPAGLDVFNTFEIDLESLTADGDMIFPSCNMDGISLEDLSMGQSWYPGSVDVPTDHDWTGPDQETDDAAFMNDVIGSTMAADMSQWGWENTQQLDIALEELYSPFYPNLSPPSATLSPTSQPSPAASPASSHSKPGAFTCPDDSCSKSFATQNLLRKHKRKHTKPFTCSVCAKGHAAKKDLHRHMWVRHPEDAEQAGLPSEMRQCPVKGCTFEGRQDNLTRHLRTRHRTG